MDFASGQSVTFYFCPSGAAERSHPVAIHFLQELLMDWSMGLSLSLQIASVTLHGDAAFSAICLFAFVSVSEQNKLRYDTIRDAILTCAQKLTWVPSLIYRTEPTTKKCKAEKLKSKKKRICLKISINSPRVSPEEEKEGNGDLQQRKVLSREWKSGGDGILVVISIKVISGFATFGESVN